MNFVFLMDPLDTVIMEKDTSFIFMFGAHNRHHKVFYLGNGGITKDGAKILFHVTEVVPQKNTKKPFQIKSEQILTEDQVDAVFIRTDPPFDQNYLHNTWMLDLLPESIPVINAPSGVRTVNEKIWVTRFPELIPPTFVGRNREDVFKFINREEDIVVKPTDGHGGKSIFHVRKGERNANVILETMTDHWKRDVILQAYIADSHLGDKRILLLNGEILGAVLRVHSKDDHRNNFFAGGKAEATTVTAKDKEIVKKLKPYLQKLGLYFVGIDVMGGYLTEVNVTSPTCLQEMNFLYNQSLEEKVILFVEKLVKERKSKRKK